MGTKELQSVYDTFSTNKKKPDMVSFGGFGMNLSVRAVYRMGSSLEGKKVSKDFPTVVNIDVPCGQSQTGRASPISSKSAGVKLSMRSSSGEGHQCRGFGNNAVVSAKQMGWNTLVFLDAKSCHYIGNQDIEPVLKNVDDCVRIALTGKIEG